jgi:hypothetical protein
MTAPTISAAQSPAPVTTDAPAPPTFAEAFWFWLKLGFISFGGPAGQIAVMHQELVEKRRWISETRFLHALNYCMLLPGPEAQQLATYIGWLLHGYRGGLTAGLLFILPGSCILALSSCTRRTGTARPCSTARRRAAVVAASGGRPAAIRLAQPSWSLWRSRCWGSVPARFVVMGVVGISSAPGHGLAGTVRPRSRRAEPRPVDDGDERVATGRPAVR